MALIDTTEELKKHNSSITRGLEVASLQSFLADAYNMKIIPAIGRAQFNALVEGKAGFAAGSNEEALLHLVQKAAANFAVGFYVAYGSVLLNNSGAQVSTSATMRPASDKKLIQLRRQSIADGHTALEMAVEFLEENLVSFPLYRDAAVHHQNRALFINSSTEFNAISTIRVDAQLFESLRNYQRGIEWDQIRSLLGETLFDALKAKVVAGDLTDDEKALLTRIQRALAPLTVAEAIPYKQITIEAGGIFQLSDTVGGISGNVENKNPANESAVQGAMVRLISKGESELESLRRWLNANQAKFSDYVVQKTAGEVNVNTPGNGLYYL